MVEVKVFECPKRLCRYRWIPRVNQPKECPECKHRFLASWGYKPKVIIVEVKSREELAKFKEDIARWNDVERWKSP